MILLRRKSCLIYFLSVLSSKGCLASLLSKKHYSLNFKKQFLYEIVQYLDLDKSVATAYLPLTISNTATSSENPDYISIFLSDMESADSLTWFILRYLLLSKQGYDSRVRTLIIELFVVVYMKEAGSLAVTPKSPIANSRSSDALDVLNFDRLLLAYHKFTYLEHYLGTNLVRLKQSAGAQQDADNGNSEKPEKKVSLKKIAKITSATVVAGTLFAVTGGLAAPGIAAGMAVLTTSSAAAASVAGVLTSTAAVTTIFGVGGGGLVGYKMKRRTAGLTEFHFEKRTLGSELSITICISGWVTDKSSFTEPWAKYFQQEVHRSDSTEDLISLHEFKSSLVYLQLMHFFHYYKPSNSAKVDKILSGYDLNSKELLKDLRDKYGVCPLEFWTRDDKLIRKILFCGKDPTTSRKRDILEFNTELYTVEWEPKLLEELSKSIESIAKDVGIVMSREILKTTAASTLMTAIAWPVALVSAANMIDGTWTLATERADEAGVELANSLLESASNIGMRPVTLMGYSMGARVIYKCLKEMVRKQKEWLYNCKKEDTREPASIIEDVVLMGLPNHYNRDTWAEIRHVVAGRLVNCFSRKDFVLNFMFQMKKMSMMRPVCGTMYVDVDGVENIDVTEIVQSHEDYCHRISDILRLVEKRRSSKI
mmetsp:Transcript_28681/g.44585  ORF Transcript_28681/g.44585 Transcript_28681/m.44585 type:complete len:652 (+) Transcript_28681:253-2208(+)